MEEKTFNYGLANISDGIAVVGELEHIRRHALRSAQLSETDEDKLFYSVIAKQAQDLRRRYMREHFQADEKLHCLGKATATLRQIAYEVNEGDTEYLHEIDALVDTVWGRITGEDLSGCQACREDMNE